MSVTYEQLRIAALELIGFAEHSDFCDWYEKKPCSCGYTAAYDVIKEAGKSTFTPDGKTPAVLTMNKMGSLVECSPTPAAFALPDGEFPLYTHPPRREWQSLSEQERHRLWRKLGEGEGMDEYGEAIEAALKEKNNG